MASCRSSHFETLKRTRFVLDAYEMPTALSFRFLEPTALGIYIRLLPYIVQGRTRSSEMRSLSRLAGVHIKTMRKWWPHIKNLFDVDDSGYLHIKDTEWLRVQSVSADRQSLRHLLDTLVAFWGNACAYCGVDDANLQIEHIMPVARGGTDDLTNLTLACQPCNLRKRTKTAAEFGFPHIHDLAARIQ